MVVKPCSLHLQRYNTYITLLFPYLLYLLRTRWPKSDFTFLGDLPSKKAKVIGCRVASVKYSVVDHLIDDIKYNASRGSPDYLQPS